jgi:hypothetical protein
MELIRDGWINHFINSSRGVQHIQIISPFITYRVVNEIMERFSGNRLEIITRFNLNDFRSGVSNLQALKYLIERGASIQGIRNLHSKVYIFDNSTAIIGSANLTSMAFYNNYEFGMRVSDELHVQECINYFNWLKERGGFYLDMPTINRWEEQLREQRPISSESFLPDYGTDPSMSNIERHYFIKLLGKSDNRVQLDFHAREEIERAHCHYALCFPTNSGRPRRYRNGDTVYMARMLEGTDYSFFGRAESLEHVDDRDYASDEEMEILDWKDRWSIYIRVRNAEFINTVMRNCPKMSELIDSLGPESFDATSRRYARGERDINPWNSLRQKADVQLSGTAGAWLKQRFDQRLLQYGKVDEAFINTLHPGSLF